MSRQAHPPFVRKSSAPWDRLRPAKQDPLEAAGFVSKGDNRLRDTKAQETFFNTIIDRYMQFCTHHKADLDAAFASLSGDGNISSSANIAINPPAVGGDVSRRADARSEPAKQSASRGGVNSRPPEQELSTILTAFRKLREGLLASSAAAPNPVFSQRVHVFNIRAAILAKHPPSYHPSLLYLLSTLHTAEYPLCLSELKEMTTYMILDLALRQNEPIAAYSLRASSKKRFGYKDRSTDSILRAVVTGNWVAFWRVRREVDGYVRALMQWHVDKLRKTTLKVFGKSYMKVDQKWLMRSVSGNEMEWEQLVSKEEIGWSKDGDNITIRKPKSKP